MNARSMPGAYARASDSGNARTDGRTDGLTQTPTHLRDDISPLVTRALAYGDFPDSNQPQETNA